MFKYATAMFFRLALAATLVGACGSGGGDSNGSHDASIIDSDAGSGSDGGVGCGDECPPACGIPTEECPTCLPCRYDQEEVSLYAAEDVAIHAGQAIDIAYLAGAEVRAARRLGAGDWSDELVVTADSPSLVDIAATDDGTIRWIAAVDSFYGPLLVYRSEGGEWTEETFPTAQVVWASLDVSSSGQPVVAFNGAFDGVQGVFLANLIDSAWQVQLVRESNTGRVAVAASNPVQIAWREMASQTVGIAVQTEAGFDIETIQGELGVPLIASVDLAVDTQGNPNVVYSRGSRYVMHATRTGGSWAISEVSSAFLSDTDAAVALGAGGSVHVGYWYQGQAIGIADRNFPGWNQQPIDNGCHEIKEFVDLASDAGGQLHVAYLCDGRVMYATRSGGQYPVGYWETCLSAAADLCARACTCGACCLESAGGSQQCTTPESSCRGDAVIGLCGDASLAPAAIETCDSVAADAECGEDGAVVPDECAANF